MIGTLRGLLLRKAPDGVIVDVNGVGYELSIPVRTLTELPAEGSEVFLNVYTHVREDAIKLFGFASAMEKTVFMSLLGVSGIGPKVALAILSGIGPDEFAIAVEAEDIELLSRIPGLGKKTANRIVLEMKGKLPQGHAQEDASLTDTVSALVNLGYKRGVATDAAALARKLGHESVEDMLKEVLKSLTGDKASGGKG